MASTEPQQAIAAAHAPNPRRRKNKPKQPQPINIDLSEWKGANAKLRQIRGRVRRLTEAKSVTMQQVQGFIRFVARVCGE